MNNDDLFEGEKPELNKVYVYSTGEELQVDYRSDAGLVHCHHPKSSKIVSLHRVWPVSDFMAAFAPKDEYVEKYNKTGTLF